MQIQFQPTGFLTAVARVQSGTTASAASTANPFQLVINSDPNAVNQAVSANKTEAQNQQQTTAAESDTETTSSTENGEIPVELTPEDFKAYILSLNIDSNDRAKAFQLLDVDNSGTLDGAEITRAYRLAEEAQAKKDKNEPHNDEWLLFLGYTSRKAGDFLNNAA
jgi:hypothetical protein